MVKAFLAFSDVIFSLFSKVILKLLIALATKRTEYGSINVKFSNYNK